MDSALQPQGVFFLFAGFSFIAIFYVYFEMDETMGLSEKAKKLLYIPGAKYGRKLRPGEEAPEIQSTSDQSPIGTWRQREKANGIGDSELRKTSDSQHP